MTPPGWTYLMSSIFGLCERSASTSESTEVWAHAVYVYGVEEQLADKVNRAENYEA